MARVIAKPVAPTGAGKGSGASASKSPSPAAFRVNRPRPTEEQIRARAYEIYLRRNGGPGDAHSDWLQAEGELHAAESR